MKILTVAIIVTGMSLSGVAQEKNALKTKHSAPEKAAKATPLPIGKSANVGTSSAANSKDLQTLERQTAKSSAAPHAAGTKPPKTAAVKPIKDKSDPPIKVGNASANGLTHQSSNRYKGRLKQKYTHQ